MFAPLLHSIVNVFRRLNPFFPLLPDMFPFRKACSSVVTVCAVVAPSEQQVSVLQCSALMVFVFLAASSLPWSNFYIFIRLLLKRMVAPLNCVKY